MKYTTDSKTAITQCLHLMQYNARKYHFTFTKMFISQNLSSFTDSSNASVKAKILVL